MKIVQINVVYHFSSTGRTTEEMHLYLKSKGIASYVFCVNISNPEDGIYSVGNACDHKFHALMSRLTGLRGYYSYFATKKILHILDEINPDIVVIRNIHANFINYPMLMAYLAKKQMKVVWVLHDSWAYTGGCTHYSLHECFKWKEKCNDCKWKGNGHSLWFDRTAKVFNERKRYFSDISNLTVVGVSDWITEDARLSFLSQTNAKITRIYNWINLEAFHPVPSNGIRKKLGFSPSDFIILGVAQFWTENKGKSMFFNMAKHFPKAKVVMVGSLQDYPQDIVHIDTVDNLEEMAKIYSMADVFVNFSQQETFGKVAAEALACGTPVIANNNTANPEVVGDCGFVIQNNNEEECYKALEIIMKNGKALYAADCRKRAETLFSKESNLDQYLKLFSNI